jgi:16S rRNA (uracil1498-N3)-methyltransferase
MRQLFLPDDVPSQLIQITGNNFRHVVQVLRSLPKDELKVIFGNREAYLGIITEITESCCTIRLTQPVKTPEAVTEIILLQGIPKGKKMDQIVRQATECGVSTIIPLQTEFSQVRLDAENTGKKNERWNRIIKEALEQSGSSVITRIGAPLTVKNLPRITKNSTLGLFFHQEILETNTLHRYLSTYLKKIYMCFGAEGGFSSTEVDHLRAADYRPVFLGNQVLRSETAVVFALGAVKTLVQEIHEWILQK